jgi:hypothetical protein
MSKAMKYHPHGSVLFCTFSLEEGLSHSLRPISSHAGDPLSANHIESTAYEKAIDLLSNKIFKKVMLNRLTRKLRPLLPQLRPIPPVLTLKVAAIFWIVREFELTYR